MKYYGFMYDGLGAKYNFDDAVSYNDPYEALISANKKWDETSEPQTWRLLIVLRKADATEKSISDDRAYFQFTSSKACSTFANERSRIEWSDSDVQKWNGDAKMMG